MSDYASFKVPELKKLLTDRGLPQAGNKADLIARLQENDAAKKGGEDEIDWDDEQPAAAKPAEAAPAAAPAVEAAPVEAPAPAAAAAPVAEAPAAEAAAPAAAEPEITHDFDIEEELKRREARAKRFGITPGAAVDGEGDGGGADKLAARAARFGIDTSVDIKEDLLASLGSALPDRPLKRGRGGDNGARGDNKRSNSRRGGNQNGGQKNNQGNNNRNRNNNRNNDNRRNNNNSSSNQKQTKSFLDDPAERKKAEERAKRFGL